MIQHTAAAAALIDIVEVLHPTRHKIGHFGDVFPEKISRLGMEKTKSNTIKARIPQSKELYYNTNNNNNTCLTAFCLGLPG